jgi:outer membrane protein
LFLNVFLNRSTLVGRSSILFRCLLGIVLLVGLITPVLGSEPADNNSTEENLWSIQLGIGTAVAPLYDGSSRYGVSVLPFFRISYDDRVSLGPGGLNLQLPGPKAYEIKVGLVYHSGRDEVPESDIGSVDDNRLRGLGNLDGTIGTKLELSYDKLPATVKGSIINFVGTDINGTLLSIELSKKIPLSRRMILVPVAGASWASTDYTRSLYGITASKSSRTNFDSFAAGAGLNRLNIGLRNRLRLSKKWMFRVGLRIERLFGDAVDSPITRDDTMIALLSGVAYQF